MNRRTQIKLRQLAILTMAWLLVGCMMTVYDYLVIHTNSSIGPSSEYSFLFSLVMNLGSAFVGSMLGGSFLIFFVNVKYQDKSYGYTLIAVSISFIIVILIIIVLLGVISVPIRTGKPLSDPASIEALPAAAPVPEPVNDQFIGPLSVAEALARSRRSARINGCTLRGSPRRPRATAASSRTPQSSSSRAEICSVTESGMVGSR